MRPDLPNFTPTQVASSTGVEVPNVSPVAAAAACALSRGGVPGWHFTIICRQFSLLSAISASQGAMRYYAKFQVVGPSLFVRGKIGRFGCSDLRIRGREDRSYRRG